MRLQAFRSASVPSGDRARLIGSLKPSKTLRLTDAPITPASSPFLPERLLACRKVDIPSLTLHPESHRRHRPSSPPPRSSSETLLAAVAFAESPLETQSLLCSCCPSASAPVPRSARSNRKAASARCRLPLPPPACFGPPLAYPYVWRSSLPVCLAIALPTAAGQSPRMMSSSLMIGRLYLLFLSSRAACAIVDCIS